MSKTFNLTLACAVLGSLACFGAQALPISPLGSQVAAPEVTLVEGGCGPGFHRNEFGRCRPNRGDEVIVVPGGPVVVAPAAPVVVAPVVCGRGFRWHPGFRRCVVL